MKKLKSINNSKYAKVSRITVLKDWEIINNNKTNLNLKTWLKKVKVIKQKQQAKLDKTQVRKKDIRKLVVDNKIIRAFKNIISNPNSIPSSTLQNSWLNLCLPKKLNKKPKNKLLLIKKLAIANSRYKKLQF